MHNVHNCIDLKPRTKTTCDITMQGNAQNYLHELTICRLAAILHNLGTSSSKSTFDYPTLMKGFLFQCLLFSAKYRWQSQKLASNTGDALMLLTSTTAAVPSADNFEWRNRVFRPLPFITSSWNNKPVRSIWRSLSAHMHFFLVQILMDNGSVLLSKCRKLVDLKRQWYLTFASEIYCLFYYTDAVVLWF